MSFFASALEESDIETRIRVWEGYAVGIVPALAILSNTDHDAANWWYREAPHLIRPGGTLVFPVDVCEVEGKTGPPLSSPGAWP